MFRDLIERPGVARYRLELAATGDRVSENNVGDGATRVQAPARILLVNPSGQASNFSRALSAGKLHVQTATPAAMPRDPAGLLAYRAVILENVPASQAGPEALAALGRFTSALGGGLLLTGGGASFGVGGYFKSVVDSHLPVSMEIKNEHRKLSLAMAVVLDRSGSMAMAAGDGRTKMDLANLGTCAAIETLGPFDEIGVIAVDSARFPLQKAGVYLGAVQLGSGAVLPLAPLSLPYSAEFEPRKDPDEGQKALSEIARVSGGVERTTWEGVFVANPLARRQVRDLVIPLTLFLLLLHLLEIAGRRLLLFGAIAAWFRSVRVPAAPRWRSKPAPSRALGDAGAARASEYRQPVPKRHPRRQRL
jgi:hypothetical protein